MSERRTSIAPSPSLHRLNRRQAFKAGTALAVAASAAAGASNMSAQEGTPEATPAAPGEAPGVVTPERAALAVSRVRAYAEELLATTGLPGMAVAVVHGDEVLLAEGFGVREIGTDEPVDAETVFQLASGSKSLAATVVSAVVGDGTVSWHSRMADVAPGFALADAWPTENVTLADLFAHRSGLRDHAGDLLEVLGFPQAEILHRLRFLTPEYSFRAGYAYTNFALPPPPKPPPRLPVARGPSCPGSDCTSRWEWRIPARSSPTTWRNRTARFPMSTLVTIGKLPPTA